MSGRRGREEKRRFENSSMVIIESVHDADYRQSQKDFNSFVETLTGKIIEKDETIPELPCKDLVS